MCARARACVQARPARIILRQPSAHLPENGIVSLGCELRGVHLRWRCHPKACGQLSSIVRVKLPLRSMRSMVEKPPLVRVDGTTGSRAPPRKRLLPATRRAAGGVVTFAAVLLAAALLTRRR